MESQVTTEELVSLAKSYLSDAAYKLTKPTTKDQVLEALVKAGRGTQLLEMAARVYTQED